VRKQAQALELPYYAKYLLIAAFLASHNSAKADKRLFVKHHGKQRKRMQTVNAKAKVKIFFRLKSVVPLIFMFFNIGHRKNVHLYWTQIFYDRSPIGNLLCHT